MKKFLTIFTLSAVALSGCSTKNDRLKIEANQALNYKRIESQADIAQAALKYLAGTQSVDKVSPSVKHHRALFPSVQTDPACEEVCRYCSTECYNNCPEFYEKKFPVDADCLSNQPPDGWHFDGVKWVCDDLLIPGLCAGSDQKKYGAAVQGDGGAISPVGNNNVIVQGSPGAQVNYGGQVESQPAEEKLLQAIAVFIGREPVKIGKLTEDKVLETVPGVFGIAADAAVKITGLSVLGSFAEKSVEQAGDRYETGGDYGSSGHNQSTGSHIVTKTTEFAEE